MKKTITKLILLTLMIGLNTTIKAQVAPNLNSANTYGILGDSLSATDTSSIIGNAGGLSYVSGYIKGINVYTGGTAVTNALNDLDTAINFCTAQSGTSISGTLNGQTLSPGVYTISGNATLTNTLTLNGDTSAVYIFNVSGNLTIDSASILLFDTINPSKIFWNITGKVIINKPSLFSGFILSANDISLYGIGLGEVCLLSKQKIKLFNVLNAVYPLTGCEIRSLGMFASFLSNCVGSLAGCGESIRNGDFETLFTCPYSISDYSNPNGLSIPDVPENDCSWEATPFLFANSTPDIFNSCSNTLPGDGTVFVPLNGVGTQTPNSGNGYMGFLAGNNQTSQYEGITQYFPNLIPGKVYAFSMAVSLADASNWATSVGFSTDGSPYFEFSYPGQITNKTGWTAVRSCFTATGTETSIRILNLNTYPPIAASGSAGYTYSPGAGFSFAYYYVDDVSLKPLVDDAPNFTYNCSVTNYIGVPCPPLAGATYNWTCPSGGVTYGNVNSKYTTITITTPGTYVFTLHATYTSSDGSTCTATDNVTVIVPPPASITLTSVGGTNSQTVTLCSAITPITYSIAGGATGATVTGLPPGVSGIFASGVLTITGTATTTGAYTYTITTTGTPLPCNNVSTTGTITVNNCPGVCPMGVPDYNIVGPINIGALPSALLTATGQLIHITGALYINQNTIWNACNVSMEPGASITLTSADLTLAKNTHVYGCNGMWNSIILPNTYTPSPLLTISGNCIIEDADSAVVSFNGGKFIIASSIFNQNFVDIAVQQYAATHPGTISASIFTCRDISSGTTLNTATNPTVNNFWTYSFPAGVPAFWPTTPTFCTTKTKFAVEARNVRNWQVGDVTSSIPNIFDNVGTGIYLYRTSAKIYNNTFQNILQVYPVPAAPCGLTGTGVYATTGSLNTSTYDIIVGDVNTTGTYYNNSFFELYQGVFISNYRANTVKYNHFVNTTTIPANIGFRAIYVVPSSGNSLDINNNPEIINFNTGIYVNRTAGAVSTLTNSHIEYNTIKGAGLGLCTTGILLADAATGGSHNFKIMYNEVYNAYNGIAATNNLNLLEIEENNVYLRGSTGVAGYAGIKLTNCTRTNIIKNDIYSTPATANTTSSNLNYRGIYCYSSPQAYVACNTVTDIAESIVFWGLNNSIPSTFINNQMTHGVRGFVLRNNGFIGPQGSSTQSSGNSWNTTSGFTSQTYTDISTDPSAAATYSPLHVNTPTGMGASYTGIPTLNFNNVGSVAYVSPTTLLIIANTIDPLPCSSLTIQAMRAMNNNELKSMAYDSAEYEWNEEAIKYGKKKAAYTIIDSTNALAGDTTTLNASSLTGISITDTAAAATAVVLQNFYDSAKVEAVGQLNEVTKAITMLDYANADAINSNVYPTNVMEENQKSINYYLLLPRNDTTYNYTPQDSEAIYNIAIQCPETGGQAVWQARVTYWLIINDVVDFNDSIACAGASIRSLHPTNLKKELEKQNFNLYPNPNNGNMTLAYHLNENDNAEVSIYDLVGRSIKSYPINSKNALLVINENELNAGTYYYSIMVNGKMVKTQKLVIIK